MIMVPKTAGVISHACAKDGTTRFGLNAVRVVADLSDQWWLEATNGKIAAVVRGPLLTAGPSFPMLEQIEPSEDFLVDRGDWDKVFKSIDLKDPRWQGAVGLAADGKQVFVSTPGGVLTCPQPESRFPDVKQVIPKMGSPCRVVLNPWLLMDLLKIAIGVAETRTGCEVVLHFYGSTQPMGVTAKNLETGNTLDALIMPLTQ